MPRFPDGAGIVKAMMFDLLLCAERRLATASIPFVISRNASSKLGYFSTGLPSLGGCKNFRVNRR